jgi:riboflavin transporter FmnP
MNTKKLTLTLVFAALTVALNPEITKIAFPAPYAPFLIYNVWEIPIVAAFLIVDLKSALAIAGLNAVVLFAFFQGVSPLGPVYNLLAIISMLAGLYVARLVFSKKLAVKNDAFKYTAKMAAVYIAFGVLSRTAVMTVVNYVTLPYPLPIGFGIQGPLLVDYYVPATSFFNATLALYTILFAYVIAGRVVKVLKLSMPDQK